MTISAPTSKISQGYAVNFISSYLKDIQGPGKAILLETLEFSETLLSGMYMKACRYLKASSVAYRKKEKERTCTKTSRVELDLHSHSTFRPTLLSTATINILSCYELGVFRSNPKAGAALFPTLSRDVCVIPMETDVCCI